MVRMTRVEALSILEIQDGATEEEIKKAYRRQALKWHPDKNPDNQEEATNKFKSVSSAFAHLTAPDEPEDDFDDFENFVPNSSQFDSFFEFMFGAAFKGFGNMGGFGGSPFDEGYHSGFCSCRACRKAGRTQNRFKFQHAQEAAAAAETRNKSIMADLNDEARRKQIVSQMKAASCTKRSDTALEITFSPRVKELWMDGCILEMQLRKTSEKEWIDFTIKKPKAYVNVRDLDVGCRYIVRYRMGIQSQRGEWSAEATMSTLKSGQSEEEAAEQEAAAAAAALAKAVSKAPAAAAPAKEKEVPEKENAPAPAKAPVKKPKKRMDFNLPEEDPEEIARRRAEEEARKRQMERAMAMAAADYESEVKKVAAAPKAAGKGEGKGAMHREAPRGKKKEDLEKPMPPLNPKMLETPLSEQNISKNWRNFIPPTLPVNPLGQMPSKLPAAHRPMPSRGAPRPTELTEDELEAQIALAIEMSQKTFEQEQNFRSYIYAQRARDASGLQEQQDADELAEFAEEADGAAPEPVPAAPAPAPADPLNPYGFSVPAVNFALPQPVAPAPAPAPASAAPAAPNLDPAQMLKSIQAQMATSSASTEADNPLMAQMQAMMQQIQMLAQQIAVQQPAAPAQAPAPAPAPVAMPPPAMPQSMAPQQAYTLPANMSSFAGLNMYQQQPADPSKAQAQPQQPQQPAMNLAGYSAMPYMAGYSFPTAPSAQPSAMSGFAGLNLPGLQNAGANRYGANPYGMYQGYNGYFQAPQPQQTDQAQS